MAEVTPRTKPSGTSFTWEMRKPHPGVVQFVIVFPDGDFWVWREVEFHDTDKIDSNISAVGALPSGWFAETAAVRAARIAAEEA
jgi:hypothetical protein